ncbi:MAG: ABC transporter ATP-binding protein [Gammaproteobacteria bacterium]
MNANATASLTTLLVRLFHHLSKRRQRQFVLVMVLTLVSALAEVVSLGAVLPFIGVLANPEVVYRQPFMNAVARAVGIESPDGLLLPLTITFAVVALATGALRMLLLWVSTRFTFAAGADLSIEVYRRTLYQPYPVHVARSSSDIISGITNKVGGTVLGVLLPVMTLTSSFLVMAGIMLTLLAIDPWVALVATAGFGISYGAITLMSRRRLSRNSRYIADEYTQVVKALQEGLGGIRDVLLDGTQPVYCEIYRHADAQLRRAQGENVFLGQSPRFAMEGLGMVLIAGLAYGLSFKGGGIVAALPVLAALALGAQRLLPALQQGYAAWAVMAGSHGSLADTIELLDQPVAAELLRPPPPALPFQEDIRFEGVRFRYTPEGPWVLNGIDLTIAKGSRVGFVGGTGSGKSTTLDLLMGLLAPTEGALLVDGEPLQGARVRAWQRTIAHVPQSIHLADATVAQNIAFGVPPGLIDMERVRQAARQAQIAEFIEERAGGYDGMVGERGVRLSGGQRQRIGIARALYKQASVLVLDEATSALDNATEVSVMASIDGLARDLTVLLIAHRLTTVRRCDNIIQLEHGCVVAQGSYDFLLERSHSFRHMAGDTKTT